MTVYAEFPVRRKTKRPVTLEKLISELEKAEMVSHRSAMLEMWPSVVEKLWTSLMTKASKTI